MSALNLSFLRPYPLYSLLSEWLAGFIVTVPVVLFCFFEVGSWDKRSCFLFYWFYPRNSVSAAYVPDAIFYTRPDPDPALKRSLQVKRRGLSTGWIISHVRLTQKFIIQPHSGAV